MCYPIDEESGATLQSTFRWKKMDINPQDFIGFPFDWLVILIIALAAWGIGSSIIKVGKKVAIILIIIAVYFFVRDAFPHLPFQEVITLTAILSTMALLALWYFFIRKK
jgi:phosphatidylserine synthase